MSHFSKEIITIGINASGIDSGDIDYSINCQMIDNLSKGQVKELINVIESIKGAITIKKALEEKLSEEEIKELVKDVETSMKRFASFKNA